MRSLITEFKHIFSDSSGDIFTFFAPGRVNLIGEHIDYNGGYVFPCALDIGTYAAVRKRSDQKVRMYSKNFDQVGIIEFDLNELRFEAEHDWANYPKGVLSEMGKIKSLTHGLDIYFEGNIPNGAGLSSSASIELVTAVLVDQFYDFQMNRVDLVKLCQKVENKFIGVNCGIMDQFAIGMGKQDHALLLNCNTLEYRYIPLVLRDCSIVIANTNKQRGLAGSSYNERRQTCEKALEKLKKEVAVNYLADLSPKQFEELAHLLSPVEVKRVRHVVTEQDRTIQAAQKLEQGDLAGFGQLMKESHKSLKEDYEVSCLELDTLVDLACEHPGTLGARMTGAGFGGCTVNVVKDSEVENFIESVGKIYEEKIGYKATFYVVKVGDGAKEIKEEEEM